VNVLHSFKQVESIAYVNVWAVDELIQAFIIQFLIVMSHEDLLIMEVRSRCQELFVLHIIKLFQVLTDAVLILAFLKMQVYDTFCLHLLRHVLAYHLAT
jgi:hypothetical protein